MPDSTPVEKPAQKDPATVRATDKLKTGKIFAWFELQRELEDGSSWLAQDYSVGRQVDQVALKFLPEFVVSDKIAVEELKNEIRRLSTLKHPNIQRVYALVESKGEVAIQMEYLDGQSLARLRLGRPNQVFEVRDLQKWVEQLCEALDYAHKEVGLVHGDIGSGNLIADPAGNLKLKDFGIENCLANAARRSNRIHHRSEVLPYRSPQRAAGKQPGISDDLYSVGATIYALLTGQPPFRAGDVGPQVSEKVPLSITERRAELGIAGEIIPKHWEETVAACLTKDPAQRPQSAAEVRTRLQNGNSPTEVSAESGANFAPKPSARRNPVRIPPFPKWWRAIFVIIFIVALGLAVTFFSFRLLTQPRLGKVVLGNESAETNNFLGRSSSSPPAVLRSTTGRENSLAAPTPSTKPTRPPLAEASPTPSATASPSPSPEVPSTPRAEVATTPSPAAGATPSVDLSASVAPPRSAASNETPAATSSPAPLSQQDTDTTKEDVLRRINAMPGVTAEKKANLVQKMNKARSMERLAVIPFESGQSTLRRAATDELIKTFDTPEMRDKLSDPTIVLVVAGYADAGGRADVNLRISQARAENVGRILKEQVKLLNAMQTIGMGGTELLDSTRPDQNRAVEVWAVVPL